MILSLYGAVLKGRRVAGKRLRLTGRFKSLYNKRVSGKLFWFMFYVALVVNMSRIYCKSGQLDRVYLRYIWMHRRIQPQLRVVHINDGEFESVVATMTRLPVMYKSTDADKLVVPARLPQYGDQRVLAPENIAEIVVRMPCSFGQVYPPPGIVGRFLAWSTGRPRGVLAERSVFKLSFLLGAVQGLPV